MEAFLQSLLITLNNIEVKGKNNMDCLLGAIMAIEAHLNQPTEEAEEDNG